MLDAAIAFFAHAPGLWLFRKIALGPRTRRMNLFALSATLILALLAATRASSWQAAIGVWLVGHVAWGAVLAARVLAKTVGN